MAIAKVNDENIRDAFKYIDENGVPFRFQSTRYELVLDDGKRYPPKYVIAVASHIANGKGISTIGFNAIEAKNFFERRGFKPIDNIGNKDYLQVLAYMFRFDAKQGFFLYPESKGADGALLRLNSGSTYEGNVCARENIFVTKHGLRIPNEVSTYNEFVNEMRKNESIFVEALI